MTPTPPPSNFQKPQPIKWTHELVQKFWDGISQTDLTQLNFSLQGGRGFLVLIDHLLSSNRSNSIKRFLRQKPSILDFGAGDGELVQLMCERKFKAAAYEMAEKRKERLKERLGGYSNFIGVVDQTTDMTFDVVVMAEVIEHILEEDMDSCLKLLNKLLCPNGFLVITTPNNENLDLSMCYCPVSNTLFHRWQHVRSFTQESLSTLLSNYGFEEVVTHKVEFNDTLYVPYDRIWGDSTKKSANLGGVTFSTGTPLPSYLTQIRANKPTCIGSESNLLYIGRRK